MTDLAWHTAAKCRGVGPELFIGPDNDESPRRRTMRERRAKAMCMQCPVRIACLVNALDRDEREGVWGGTTADERELMIYGALASDAS